MRNITEAELVALEVLVDAIGLSAVADALCVVCHEKADHLRSNWADDGQAKLWAKAAVHFDNVGGRLNRLLCVGK